MADLTIDQVASLFDRVDENLLQVFYFNPNPTIKQAGTDYTLTIKDRFKVKFKKYRCYYEDLEDCWIAFRGVMQDNILTVMKLRDIIGKLEIIVKADSYDTQSITDNNTSNMSRLDIARTKNTKVLSGNENSKGSVSGQADRTASNVIWDKNTHDNMMQSLTDKKEMALMQVLNPHVQSMQQDFELNKNYDFKNADDISNDLNRQMGSSIAKYKNVRKVDAANEIAALTAAIPALIEDYLEKFRVLFYI